MPLPDPVAYIFPRLQQIISRGDDLPTLPTIVMQLHRVLDDPHVSVTRVAQLIDQDPALTTRLLRIGNSAAFGRSGPPISGMGAAISRLGLNQVRAICTVLAVVKAFGRSRARLDHEEFWSHSVTVATLARRLWETVGDTRVIRPEDAYLVGLLHDVGLLLVDQYFPDEFSQLLDQRADHDAPIGALEEEHLGIDHGAVASLLIGRWALPEFVADAVYHHNHPEAAPPEVARLTTVIAAAEAMCWQLDVGLAVEGRPPQPAAVRLRALDVPATRVHGVIDWTEEAYLASRELLA